MIKDLKTGMNNVNLRAKVIEVSQPKQILTKFGTQTTLTIATLQDNTGIIKATLWGTQSDGVQEGTEIEINKGFVKEFREELQLSIGKGGAIKVVG